MFMHIFTLPLAFGLWIVGSTGLTSSSGVSPSFSLHRGPPNNPGHAPPTTLPSLLPYMTSTSSPTATASIHRGPPNNPGHAPSPTLLDTIPTYTPSPKDDSDDDDFEGEDEEESCDYSLSFKDLDELNNSADKYLSGCLHVYAHHTLLNMLDTACDNYTKIDDGYDREFGYYTTYMKKLVPQVLTNTFMFNANVEFTGTRSFPAVGPGMNFFDCQTDKKGSQKFPCSELEGHYLELEEHTTTLTLRDHDGYVKALSDAGISEDWVTWGDYDTSQEVVLGRGSKNYKYKFSDFPVQNKSMVVPNPKDIVSKGIGSIPDLRLDMQATYLDMILGQWAGDDGGSLEDPAMAYSAPVFMLMQANDGMAQAKAYGQQEEKDEKKEAKRKKDFILLIVGIVLMFVPVVGEELAMASGLASLAKGIYIAGEVGNAALATYDSVTDPSNAVVNILGMLFGVAGIAKAMRDGQGIAKVATIKRGMSLDKIKQYGVIFQKEDEKLDNMMKMCRLR